jgi:CLIP-associating protein 1/2
MSAMQRVEGLILGGAAEWDAFYESAKGLTQALTQQFKERRSTIARQDLHKEFYSFYINANYLLYLDLFLN